MKKNRLFILILCLFFVSTSISAKIQNNISLRRENALTAELFDSMGPPLSEQYERQDMLDLIQRMQEKISEYPDDYTNYEMLAFAYNYIGEYDKSLKAMKLLIKNYPRNAPDRDVIWGNLARQYLNLERLEQAKLAVDKALLFNPDNTVNHIHSLNYYVIKKRYKDAASDMKIVNSAYKDQDVYYDIYVWAMDMGHEPAGLIELFKEAVIANPSSEKARRTLAVALRNASFNDIEKVLPEVMDELHRAIKLNPRYIPTYISIADTYWLLAMKTKDKKYFREAMSWLAKARRIDPKNPRLAYTKGNILVSMERYDEAIAELEFAIEKGLNSSFVTDSLAHAYNAKAYSYYKKNENLSKGLKLIDKAIALKPNDGILLGTKAELLYKMGRFKGAHDYIKEALVLEPDHEEMKQDLVNIEKALKGQEKSKK